MSSWRHVHLEDWRNVPLEACPPGGRKNYPPGLALFSLEKCPAGEMSSWRHVHLEDWRVVLLKVIWPLEKCPPGGMSPWRHVPLEACPPGGMSPWRHVPLEACPPGGQSDCVVVCQPRLHSWLCQQIFKGYRVAEVAKDAQGYARRFSKVTRFQKLRGCAELWLEILKGCRVAEVAGCAGLYHPPPLKLQGCRGCRGCGGLCQINSKDIHQVST